MSTTTTRAAMTYEMTPCAEYGYALAALAELGEATSHEIASFLAERNTPYGGPNGEHEAGSLGRGWYPMSVARLVTQIVNHGFPVARDADNGKWRWTRTTSAQRHAVCECYRLCAVDGRPRMTSTGN